MSTTQTSTETVQKYLLPFGGNRTLQSVKLRFLMNSQTVTTSSGSIRKGKPFHESINNWRSELTRGS